MRISFFSTSLKFSGGRMAMFRHANELARRGHEVSVWIHSAQSKIEWMELHVPAEHFTHASLGKLPSADLCIFDRVRLAPLLQFTGLGKVVHFCQGFEGTDTELRIRSAWSQRGLLGLSEIWRLRRRLGEIERAYRLPTAKIVTHRHLGELIARRFAQICHLVPCGLPTGIFAPPASPLRSRQGRTVLVVGPTDIGWKRVLDALCAVQILKRRRPGVRLVRVAQHPMRQVERSLGVTDEYHTMLTPPEMAELYRQTDVMLSSSDATEGFGLPVLEAMASGLPCVVTDIPAFRSFANPDNYAHFVPVGYIERMAGALAYLLDAPAERQRLCSRGLQVAAEYTMQRSYNTMEAVLLRIASGSTHPFAAGDAAKEVTAQSPSLAA